MRTSFRNLEPYIVTEPPGLGGSAMTTAREPVQEASLAALGVLRSPSRLHANAGAIAA